MNKLGIANLKLFVAFVLGLQQEIREASKDGCTFMDSLGLVDNVSQLPALISNAGQIHQEVIDLDEEERAELNFHIQEQFDIPNDRIEAVIEESIDFGFQTWRYISRMARLLKK